MEHAKVRILIVDDHPMVREGLSLRINREPDLMACCLADTVDSALAACSHCQHQLALVDLRLAEYSGLMLIKQLRHKFPNLAILVISMHDENIYAERAFQAGAHGYIMKQEAMDTLIQAIRVILKGHLYVSDALRTQLIRQFMRGHEEKSAISRLSAVEFDVLNLLGMSLSSRQIAEKLNRSPKTIESHCANIKKKLGLSSGRELTQYAIEWFRGDQDTTVFTDF
ncbi:MAG: response regulator transcription factor [Methylobacter sp.]